eukprot:s788_g17.t5
MAVAPLTPPAQISGPRYTMTPTWLYAFQSTFAESKIIQAALNESVHDPQWSAMQSSWAADDHVASLASRVESLGQELVNFAHLAKARLLAASAAADMGPFRVQLGKTFAQMER